MEYGSEDLLSDSRHSGSGVEHQSANPRRNWLHYALQVDNKKSIRLP